MTTAPTFSKEERIVSNLLIETLFEKGNSHSLTAYPLRAVFLKTEHHEGCAPVQLLISVPKKRFKHAVDRNRVKRQVREAYRKNKSLLEGKVNEDEMLLIAINTYQLNSINFRMILKMLHSIGNNGFA